MSPEALAESLRGALASAAEALQDRHLTIRQAAELMGVSERHLTVHLYGYVRRGLKVWDMESRSARPRNRHVRILRSSVLALARGLGDLDPTYGRQRGT